MHGKPINLSIGEEMISVTQAAVALGKSPDTIRRYAIKYGIGRQLDKNGAWSVSLAALKMVYAKDPEALTLYRNGDRDAPRVRMYFQTDGS
ncbi:hypothetical protein [Phyllobacterium sp. SB3]|uniref:hypothetical protein n=1 Tax=Phyllobacterium sp. SB3 TaxID=3156073 RepID=UPI0032AF98B2